jgi:regulator of protease activity HflC (stomatin/prohibitin superfamily)
MATIVRFPFVRHLRSTPTSYVVHLSKGRVRHQGRGVTFWFRPLTAALSEVPVDDRELPLVAHARSADFQDMTAQVTVSFRFDDPALVAERIDFSLDPSTGHWVGAPLEQVAHLLTELAAGQVLAAVAQMSLVEAITTGVARLQHVVATGLASDPRLGATGISVLGARVGAARASADLEKYLQTPARELAQSEADKATYERRALAVERERAIAENELANRIELANREQELVLQEGRNARARADETAAATLIEATASAEREGVAAEAAARRTRLEGDAQAAADAAHVAVYAGLPAHVLTMLTLREVAGHLPAVGTLTVTPDLVTGALAGMLGRPSERGRD